ncbi:MAG TPA: response regulator [Rhodocyclaceae bacterium]|nr:response regulator [Rhodocyclaceae bacterium]
MSTVDTSLENGLISGLRRLRVLIVEDDFARRKLLSALVSHLGDEAMEACHGLDALSKAEGFRADMVITGLRTANLSGVEVIGALRRRAAVQPHVFVTGYSDEENDVSAALDGGADDWIFMPIRQDIVLHRLRIGRRIVQLELDNRSLREEIRRYAGGRPPGAGFRFPGTVH